MTARTVHLLRHGPPIRPGLLLGHTDDPAATSDCPEIAARTAGLPIAAVVSSDLVRAAAQARHLAARRGVPLALDPRWRELCFGLWDGHAAEAVDRRALARFWDEPDVSPPPQGERWSDLKARVGAAVAELGPDTLVVTHAGAMRAAVSVLTGLDHRTTWAFDLPYRARLSLRIWAGDPARCAGSGGQVVALDTEGGG
jgi:alpha-ribazole phosphatase